MAEKWNNHKAAIKVVSPANKRKLEIIVVGTGLGGASAAVSTIFVAIATKVPRYALKLRFIGSVELWVLAAIWVAMSILQLANPDNGGAIAHLSGAVFGFIYAKQLEKAEEEKKIIF